MIEESLVRSLVASKLDGMALEVASRAVTSSGALRQPPLSIKHADPTPEAVAPAPAAAAAASQSTAATATSQPANISSDGGGGGGDICGGEQQTLLEIPVWGLDAYTR